MPYTSGTANDLGAIKNAIVSACTSNGWTGAGNVVYKGNVYVNIAVVGAYLTFQAGIGIDGNNNLTGAQPVPVRIGQIGNMAFTALTWPLSYFIHVQVDEIYLVINYNVDQYQWAAFGQSTVQGLPGTGVWCAATCAGNFYIPGYISIAPDSGNSYYPCPAFFYSTQGINGGVGSEDGNSYGNAFIHHGLDARTWSGGTYNNNIASGIYGAGVLQKVLPNIWNSESNLLPIQVCIPRTSGNKVSLVADMQHSRYLRIDNYAPGDIITLGPDRWKVYPWWKKVSAYRDGTTTSTGIEGTGTMGWAIRYDGP
ncbi:MAG: hypothetical protein ABI171_00670 [Collimonas sp.]|uniref:hypothetical protein n=1 Tax=Collimonas sp. TaxID=1963772 RepID=UPI003265CA1D